MKGKDLVKLLKKNGWTVDRIHGSHYIMKKDGKTETIPVHNTDIPIGLANAIMKRTGLK
ncbi:MAG: type II toxin-antitoxin system HicA family toxin [Emergencia sp.]|nr:type II toxin-antitoxin system HicA family toxin [Emergencia sp.]